MLSPFAILLSYYAIQSPGNVHDADLRTWAECQSVLSQTRLPTPKREEFFQSDGTGLRDVVHGVGTWKACQKMRLIGSFNEQGSPAGTLYPPLMTLPLYLAFVASVVGMQLLSALFQCILLLCGGAPPVNGSAASQFIVVPVPRGVFLLFDLSHLHLPQPFLQVVSQSLLGHSRSLGMATPRCLT